MINMKNKKIYKLIFLIILISIPWLNSIANNDLQAATPSQEDLSFYEINPCEVSLANFIFNNFNSIYQDHFSFIVDNYSSVKCFGKVTGATLLDNGFVISIGTNSLINLLLQSLFWIGLISFIKIDKNILFKKNIYFYFCCLATSLTLLFLIYSEYRFYDGSLFLIDLKDRGSLGIIFVIILFISTQFMGTTLSRFNNISNFIPFIFIISSVFSGYNFSLFMIFFIYLGFYSIITTHNLRKFNKIYFIFSLFWVFNASNSFYLPPSKLRGFSSVLYEFNSVLAWTILTFLLINGAYFFYQENLKFLKLKYIVSNFNIAAIFSFTIGLMSANFPLFNFFNFYYLGHQRYGIKTNNPFTRNEWGEAVSWRGTYSSAESIGEFYGIAIILTVFAFFLNKKITILEVTGLLFSIFGLVASNNRTVLILVLLSTSFLAYKHLNFPKLIKNLMIISTLSLIMVLIGYQNLNYAYNFTSQQMFSEALNYSENSISSYLNLLINNYENKTSYSYLFGFISYFAFILNRAEVWGLFFSRYNPTFTEFAFGSGPLNFGQFYGEIQVSETRSFLLPHSSFLSLLLFVGILGCILLVLILISSLIKNRKDMGSMNYILFGYIILNLVKNDTINYFPSFITYSFLIFIAINSKDFFRSFVKH
tara:strand:+ start:1274 stop:3220 length:1947 start_codon:yes stop_codon:yes gene_type:complete